MFFTGAIKVASTSGKTLIQWKDYLLENGQSALSHTFDYGGFGPVDLGAEIDWSIDPYLSVSNGNERGWHPDLRIVWELNRCSHLPVLGLAHNVTDNDSYAEEIVLQMQQWGDSNPLWSGANWKSSMEASIRITIGSGRFISSGTRSNLTIAMSLDF